MRRLLILSFLAAVACHKTTGTPSSTSAEAGEPVSTGNVFAKDEQPTSFVNETLQRCMAGLEKAEVAGKKRLTKTHVKAWYCVCMTDALGVAKKPAVSVDAAGPRCVAFAEEATRKTPTSTRTPYTGKSYLNAGQMGDALKGCRNKLEQGAKTQTLEESQKETFCGCIVDSMRFRRTSSTSVPVAETRVCAEAAGWSW
jgi:hypothetical protein